MVELEEVEDHELEAPQRGPLEDDEDSADFTDTDSSLSTSSLPASYFPSETLSERILALREMVSPSTRRRIYNTASLLTGQVTSGALWGLKGMWVLSASALMIGVPWAMAFVEEQQMLEMEREQRVKESTGEVLTPGASTSQTLLQARAPL